MPPTTPTVAPAQFSLAPGQSAGNMVRRPGKLFETGVWPPAPNRPSGFSLNAAEADAVTGMTVPIEIEHVRSILDGKLGTATFTERNGADLGGFLTLPKALNDLIGPDEALKVSVVWDTATKRPLRVGLVLNPAITGAQVSAAFSASATVATGRTLVDQMNGVVSTRNATQDAFSAPIGSALIAQMNGRP